MKRTYVYVMALVFIILVSVMVAMPAFAGPGVAPECSDWSIIWEKTGNGWWYGQWVQWCYSPSWGWWQNFAGWFWA